MSNIGRPDARIAPFLKWKGYTNAQSSAGAVGRQNRIGFQLYRDGARVTDLSALYRVQGKVNSTLIDSLTIPTAWDWLHFEDNGGDLLVLNPWLLGLSAGSHGLLFAWYDPTHTAGLEVERSLLVSFRQSVAVSLVSSIILTGPSSTFWTAAVTLDDAGNPYLSLTEAQAPQPTAVASYPFKGADGGVYAASVAYDDADNAYLSADTGASASPAEYLALLGPNGGRYAALVDVDAAGNRRVSLTE